MKITIDTQSDSKDELKRMISFLQHLVNSENSQNFEPVAGFSDMFADTPVEEKPEVSRPKVDPTVQFY